MNAQIWVRFYDLPWEFWHLQILSDMARGIEVPLKFERATLESDCGHFARMLIDVDLSKPLPDSIMIEVGEDCLFPTLYFENVPSFWPIILPRQEEALKYSAHLDVSTDPSHIEHVNVDATTDPVIAHIEPLIDPPMVEPHFHTLKGEVGCDSDNEGTESDCSHPAALDITCIHGGISWTDQLEDSDLFGALLWTFLVSDAPWLVLRDFNSVLGAHETTGNISTISCEYFRAVLIVCDLVDIKTKGVFYTRIGQVGLVITKIIADRLAKICSRIISPNQFGFIRDRQIRDRIAGASECFNVLSTGSHGGHMALNIDIRKALDSISWHFLFKVLRCFGFSENFIGSFLHSFQVDRWPSSLLKDLNVAIHNFFGLVRSMFVNLSKLLGSLAAGLKSHYTPLMLESRWLVSRHSKVRFLTDNSLGDLLINLVKDSSSLQHPLDSVMGEFIRMLWVGIFLIFCVSHPDLAYVTKKMVVSNDPDSLV
ncbi:hypothetical protein Dsin_027043 [Dipteronia sinensis]|uniref:Reverse transcriptase domain-containing protein n=1 Tax=Dipteronia sinensis TaxID=43782 RepID=A0AAE0A0C7_9ROSI|nr:hypothetical protein Dsin_027043 [Dipteronia sinensis]